MWMVDVQIVRINFDKFSLKTSKKNHMEIVCLEIVRTTFIIFS